MKFSRKITKLGEPLTYRRAWRRAQRLLHPIPLRSLLAQIDQARLKAIQDKHASSPEFYAKYLVVPRYLKLNIRRVQDLRLHRAPPQDVLDLGSGAGFFLFVLKQYGHRVLGLDTYESSIFLDFTELLSVPRKTWTIQAFRPLPDLGRKFDWITAFSTAFHGAGMDQWRWGAKEWSFFLDDLDQHLKPGGRIFLAINPAYGGEFYTPEILDLFLSRGAAVERENALFSARK